jgi:hypothetical protein
MVFPKHNFTRLVIYLLRDDFDYRQTISCKSNLFPCARAYTLEPPAGFATRLTRTDNCELIASYLASHLNI